MRKTTSYEIKTKFGSIYVERLVGNREEEDRIKIFDSDNNYIDYVPIETLIRCATEKGITIEEEYATMLNSLREAESIYDLMKLITEGLVAIYTNDYVNHIGNYYVTIKE